MEGRQRHLKKRSEESATEKNEQVTVFLKERSKYTKGTTVAPDCNFTPITVVPKADQLSKLCFSHSLQRDTGCFWFSRKFCSSAACTIGRQSILQTIYIYIYIYIFFWLRDSEEPTDQ